MALHAINAANQTIAQVCVKTANLVASEKKYMSSPVLDQSKQDQSERSDDKSDYLFVGALYVGAVAKQTPKSNANKWYGTISIGGKQISCKLDTEAEANVLPSLIRSKM